MNLCPRCRTAGRTIEPVTLEAQVVPDRFARLSELEGWWLCALDRCDVVYFRGDEEVTAHETHAVPFHKSSSPDRLVCFCFEHSVSEIEADVSANETSTIRASIAAACRAGRDDCERRNPQGRCCLGNVGQVVKHAASSRVESSRARTKSAFFRPSAGEDTGLFTSGAALAAAALSSACCWLPLAAIGLGVSSAGVGALFAAWRAPLLAMTGTILVCAFYLVYRKPNCVPGEACEAQSPRLRYVTRIRLWLATLLVAAVASLPAYVGTLTAGGGTVPAAARLQTTVRYRVEGMTCAGCEGHAREAIEAIPDVASVAVSYRDGSAEVAWRGAANDTAVADALAALGYRIAGRQR